jgi:hypothetical protein
MAQSRITIIGTGLIGTSIGLALAARDNRQYDIVGADRDRNFARTAKKMGALDKDVGSLEEAVNLTGLFIKKGPVVQSKDSNGSPHISRDRDTTIAYDGPLVVLTNRLSASASEIFAAALQDYNRAVDILEKYHDTRIDFVDACIMALAERLQLKRILTFDHRDFGIFRPAHIERFELLP